MKPLPPPDSHHLAAAEGWLGLSNPTEARHELARIARPLRTHPEVMRVRYQLYASTKKWALAAKTAQALCRKFPEVPFGCIHLAYALHELKRTSEAYTILLPAVERFPDQYVVRYNLACYACQLGRLDEARRWLKRAIALAGSEEIKRTALADPDLQPLWTEIQKS